MGQLVRILPGLFRSRLEDFGRPAGEKELYFIFYDLEDAVRDGRCAARDCCMRISAMCIGIGGGS
jgi:hypothetical protein